MPYLDDQPQPIDLRAALVVLRRRRWSVVLPACLTVIATLAFVGLRTPLYSSTVRVEVLPRTTQETLAPTYGASFANMDTESARVTSAQIEARASDLLVADGRDAALASDAEVSVSVPVNTTYLDITCTAERPDDAQACAGTYARAYLADRKAAVDRASAELRKPIEAKIASTTAKIAALDARIASTEDDDLRGELERQQTTLQQTLTTAQITLSSLPRASATPAQIVTPPDAPTEPSNKDFASAGALAAVLGIALGIGSAFLRQRLDGRVGEREGLDEILGAPLVAVIPHVRRRRRRAGSAVISIADPDGHAAEAYRSARPMLLHLAREQEAKTILIAGPGEGEGKSTTVANLGVVLARAGYRVAVLSCDLRKPSLHRLFDLPMEPGLTDVLAQRIPLPKALTRTEVPNLLLLASGAPPANPSELLASAAMAAVIDAISTHADFVLLDSSPSLLVADTLELAPHVDGMLVVVDGSTTAAAEVLRLRRQLEQVGARVLGCVLNNVDARAASPYGAYSAYGGYVRDRSDERAQAQERAYEGPPPEANGSLGSLDEGSRVNGRARPHAPTPGFAWESPESPAPERERRAGPGTSR